MLANCSASASLFARYTAVLAAFLAFRYSSLVPQFFHYFCAFHSSFTELSTSLFRHHVSLSCGHPPSVDPHISSALPVQIPFAQHNRSGFDRFF